MKRVTYEVVPCGQIEDLNAPDDDLAIVRFVDGDSAEVVVVDDGEYGLGDLDRISELIQNAYDKGLEEGRRSQDLRPMGHELHQPNLSNNWVCPVCRRSDVTPVLLVPIPGSEDEDGVHERQQIHTSCCLSITLAWAGGGQLRHRSRGRGSA